jgi:VanZ family protein
MPRPRTFRAKLALVVGVFALVYWLAMFIGTHLPGRPVPLDPAHSWDKVEHVTAFAGLAMLLCVAGALWRGASQRLLVMVLGLLALYGIMDEMTQQFLPFRTPDTGDWLANMLGAGLGLSLFWFGWGLLPERSQLAHRAHGVSRDEASEG